MRLVDQVSSVIHGITKVFCKKRQGEHALSTTPRSCRTLVDWSQGHLLGCLQGPCPAPLPPKDDRNSLYRKPLRTRGSAEGRPRARGPVRTGSHLPADWHARQRINVRCAMPFRGETVAEDN